MRGAHLREFRISTLSNDYRLVVAVAYRFAALYIKFVGTHAEYDAIDASAMENLP
jgi:mRNA interferase HigB